MWRGQQVLYYYLNLGGQQYQCNLIFKGKRRTREPHGRYQREEANPRTSKEISIGKRKPEDLQEWILRVRLMNYFHLCKRKSIGSRCNVSFLFFFSEQQQEESVSDFYGEYAFPLFSSPKALLQSVFFLHWPRREFSLIDWSCNKRNEICSVSCFLVFSLSSSHIRSWSRVCTLSLGWVV